MQADTSANGLEASLPPPWPHLPDLKADERVLAAGKGWETPPWDLSPPTLPAVTLPESLKSRVLQRN